MNGARQLSGAVLIGMAFGGAIWLAEIPLSSFVDAPSAIWIGLVTIGALLLSHRPRHIVAAVVCGLTGRAAETASDRARHASVYNRLHQAVWCAGITGALVGAVLMLSKLDDPQHLGAGMALALLTLLYAAVIAEVVVRVLWSRAVLVADDSQEQERRGSWPALLGVATTLLLVFAVVVLQRAL